MAKNIILFALCSLLVAPCSSAEAQQPKKLARIGYVSATDHSTDLSRADAIRMGLRELGYVEGRDIAIEYRYAEGHRDRYAGLLAELVRLNLDLIIVAGGDPLIRSASDATKSIPVIMTGGGADPVEAGLIKSLARLAVTSPELQTFPPNWVESGWSCSKRLCPTSLASQFFTIRCFPPA